jgi:UPF0755 protein
VLSFFRWVLFFIALLVTLMGGALLLGHEMLVAQGPLEKTKNVLIPRGAGPSTMAKALEAEGVISHGRLFRIALMVDPNPKPIKAGEYEVPAHISMAALVDLLQSGKVVQRRLTVPEGATTAEIVELVRKTEALTGDVTLDVKEGDLLPETYFYSRGDTRDGVLSRMKEAMEKTLDEAWRKRAAGLPYANKREALIMASIVEKETGQKSERGMIAGVFVNRLKAGMLLQTDPTVIYGMGEKYEGKIRKKDLETDTPYNTYVRVGLPPTPISLPGVQSLQAALAPARTEALYFVSRGDGTSKFSDNLNEHNKAVNQYQRGATSP